jgi:hypothetical protein
MHKVQRYHYWWEGLFIYSYAAERASDGLTLVHTKFHEDQFRNFSNAKVIISIWDAVVLVLLMRVNSYSAQLTSGCMIYIQSNDRHFKHSSNINGIAHKIWKAIGFVLLVKGIHNVSHSDGRHDMRMPSFMKTAADVTALLICSLRNRDAVGRCELDLALRDLKERSGCV